MKIKKREMIGLWNALTLCKNHKNTKFVYAVVKNKKILSPHIEVLKELHTPTEAFLDYEKKRVAICQKYCKKEGEKPIEAGGSFVFTVENSEKVKEEIFALKEKHADEISEYEAQMKEYRKLIEEEEDIKLHQVKMEDCPSDLDVSKMELLFPMIAED